MRQYSLCNAPDETDRYILGVKREPDSRGGSSAVHAEDREGQTLQISPPRNHFALHGDASRAVLFAAGIDITPLLAMAQALFHGGRDFSLHYFTRSPGHVAFSERLQPLESVAGALHVYTGARVEDTARAVAGALHGLDPSSHVYACGPAPIMSMVQTCIGARLPVSHFHVEHFAAPASETAGDALFEVVAARSGVRCVVPPGESIAGALRRHGVEVEVSCEQGVCGTCITRVLAGQPDHRDVYLSEAEKASGEQMTPCCSRSLSPVLELDI
ncbi:PDR/VanB family oxidoreductase [Paraburkholderia silviterrae]|uniref:Oxidoreductase n=1 Tax=Paraburkholderia silviterrae TaxID=2528715 RepID=A0A4R5M5R7_9BURK|nr:oxidoreductase [Paraburkholderia silviterrae]